MEALKENPVLLSDLSSKSVDASGQKPNSIEMFDVVSQGAADGNFGFGGSFYANNISPVISRSADLLGIPMNTDGSLPAEAKEQILNKLRTVNANSTIGDQRAASVFKAWMDVSPNLDMNKDAAAAIASTLLMSNQDAIDEAKFVRRYVNSDTLSLASSGRTAYNQTYGALRQTEKENLSNLIKMSGDESVRTFMEEARKGIISKEEAQRVLSDILSGEASPLLYRYFVME
jgi:ribosomal protein S20